MRTREQAKKVYDNFEKGKGRFSSFEKYYKIVSEKQRDRELMRRLLTEIANRDTQTARQRFNRVKNRAILYTARRASVPTSSANASYSRQRGSETVTTYSRSSKWRPSVARDTYVYLDGRRLCYETGRGREGKTDVYFPQGVFYSRLENPAISNFPGAVFCEKIGRTMIGGYEGNLYRLYNRSGECLTLEFVSVENGIQEHGSTTHKILREIQHKKIVAIRQERERKAQKIDDRRARLILRLVKRANFPVYYDDARHAGYCKAGIDNFLIVHAPDLLHRRVTSYYSVRRLMDGPEKYRIEKILLTAIRRELSA